MFTVTQKKQDGFTLIELMIVVALIGILSMLTLQQYRNYVVRAASSEAYINIEGVRGAMTTRLAATGTWSIPPGTYTTGNYISNITAGGTDAAYTITVTFKPGIIAGGELDNKTIVFTFNNTTGLWKCDDGTLANAYRPRTCQVTQTTPSSIHKDANLHIIDTTKADLPAEKASTNTSKAINTDTTDISKSKNAE
ncbi:MAG: hypothetical protein A3F13_08935 [Gammaproteobacteria bacterium RIFCSPHIGHO2_12_FULL_40_19]|nr:MAG: hypothetical protein A3F13_08935 [Gammaproteobacteria bacterium RIFCSPHIGHO2_12_FULL_40_19]